MSSPIRSIPGSFMADCGQPEHSALPPKLDVNVGARSHIFQPPRTPSASSSLVQSSAPSDYRTPSLSGGASRKRARKDGSADNTLLSTVRGPRGGSVDPKPQGTSVASSTAASPTPLANTRYRLADGVDRPARATNPAQRATALAQATVAGSERVAVGTKRVIDEDDYDDYGFRAFGPSSRHHRTSHNGYDYSSESSKDGWGRIVFEIVGNVAGRVWDFCRAGGFRGFHAGGGPGYLIEGPDKIGEEDGLPPNGRGRTPDFHPDTTSAGSTGRSGGDGFAGSYVNLENSPRRAVKRIQREKGRSGSKENWVIVSAQQTASSPDSRRSRASEAGLVERPSTRTGRPSLQRPATSRAGPRSTPTRPARASASFASPRASPSSHKEAALMSPETRRLMVQRRRLERANEASMQDFNRRLKAMIQEGKAALGTTYAVEDAPDYDVGDTDDDDDDIYDAGDDQIGETMEV